MRMFHFYIRICFVGGIFCGFLLAVLISRNEYYANTSIKLNNQDMYDYNLWFDNTNYVRDNFSMDEVRYSKKTYELESDFLFQRITVLCVVFVKTKKNVEAIKNTWGHSCNDINFVYLNQTEGLRKLPRKKTKENSVWAVYCKLIQNLPNTYQWFLFVYDTTYVILENLRYLTAPLDFKNAYYLGYAVLFWTIRFNKARAGYVLSLGAIEQLKKEVLRESCMANYMFLNQEDLYLGKLLSQLSIDPMDSRDNLGLSRFHPYTLLQEFFPGLNYHKDSIYSSQCCSPRAITFQVADSDKMYMYHYLLHTVQKFESGVLGNVPAVNLLPKDYVWKEFLHQQGIYSYNISSEEYYRLWVDIVNDPTVFAQGLRDVLV